MKSEDKRELARILAAPVALSIIATLAMVAAVYGSPRAHSEAPDLITRSEVTAIVRALEAQAKATQDLAREVRDAGRECKR